MNQKASVREKTKGWFCYACGLSRRQPAGHAQVLVCRAVVYPQHPAPWPSAAAASPSVRAPIQSSAPEPLASRASPPPSRPQTATGIRTVQHCHNQHATPSSTLVHTPDAEATMQLPAVGGFQDSRRKLAALPPPHRCIRAEAPLEPDLHPETVSCSAQAFQLPSYSLGLEVSDRIGCEKAALGLPRILFWPIAHPPNKELPPPLAFPDVEDTLDLERAAALGGIVEAATPSSRLQTGGCVHRLTRHSPLGGLRVWPQDSCRWRWRRICG